MAEKSRAIDDGGPLGPFTDEEFRALVRNTPAMIWLSDEQDRFRCLASGWRKALPDAIENAFADNWIDSVHPDERRHVAELFRSAVERRESFEIGCRCRDEHGRYHEVLSRGVPRIGREGKFAGYVGLTVDISEFLHSRLYQCGDSLELPDAFTVDPAEEFAASGLVSRFAHELSQPVAAAMLYLHSARQMFASLPLDSNEAVHTLDKAAQQLHRLSHMVARLKELVASHMPDRRCFDVRQLLDDVCANIEADLRNERVELRLEIANSLPPAIGSSDQITQVLVHLIRNSIAAMQRVAPSERLLVIRVSPADGSFVQWTVCDSGTPCSDAVFSRLFEPFFTTSPDAIGGGLTVSRMLVEANGGELWATRNPNSGLSVHFTLPAEG